MQSLITYIIVGIAAAYLLYRLIRRFTTSRPEECCEHDSSQCHSCKNTDCPLREYTSAGETD
ncbi:MAG: hypothetical protein MJY90_03595 [Bacteroidaceae bacterium]|nr:hypothetical protein [Bacteroidaceae bacterium]